MYRYLARPARPGLAIVNYREEARECAPTSGKYVS